MRIALRVAAVAIALGLPGIALAQQPEVPRPSPSASVSQRVGLTDVAVEYSSPGVKGRPIWGELVPYGELWRTGANAATKLTVSRAVKIGGKDLPAGSYSLFTIPAKEGDWTVVLNADTKLGGTRGYDTAKDVARFEAKTSTIPKRERMTFVFANTTDDATSLDLEWDTLRLSVPITTDTATHAAASVGDAVKAAAAANASAARWMLDQGKDLERALTLVEASLAADETWFATWIKAQLLEKTGKRQEARAAAQQAWDLGKKAEFFFYEDQVKKALEDWK